MALHFTRMFVLVMACGTAAGLVMSAWAWLWPQQAFLGSVTTLAAVVFGVLAALSRPELRGEE